ncbi:MAG TPA: T9SS type A sorting domain-containing protein [Flavobacteriales bacterium]|nr:T9SS type A sorting domain-containing protein [Flavobacteriales bacterium]
MLRQLTLLVCAIGSISFAQAQGCLPEGIALSTQAQVNSFPTDHPGCTTIQGFLLIAQGNITDLTPLAQLTAVEGYLQVGLNPQLTNLAGLENITSVGGSLGITGNAQLTDMSGLSGLTTVGGLMEVSENNSLTSLAGLQNIISVGSYLDISDSPGLTDLQGLEGIETISGSLIIRDNTALASMQGLAPISIGGGLDLMNNPQLMDLSAALGLTSLGGPLSLIGNTAILSLQELAGITSINGVLRVMGSSGLMSLDGLENIDPNTILNLIIVNNPGLFQCAAENLCTYLGLPENLANITGNATGCSSRAEVEEACTLLSVEEGKQEVAAITVFPNPTNGPVMIRAELNGPAELDLLDQMGRLLRTARFPINAEGPVLLDLAELHPGAYILQLRTNDRVDTRMVVRE